MSLELTTVSHPTSDLTRPCVIIRDTLSGKRTIIGSVPEGLQRKCSEMGIRMSRIENVFITGFLDWSRISGLPGMILTIADQGLKKLGIHHSGNSILQYIISTWRFFVFRFGLDLNTGDINESYKGDKFSMVPINIRPTNKIRNPNDSAKYEELLSKLDSMVNYIFPKDNGRERIGPVQGIQCIALPNNVINEKVSTNWLMISKSMRGKFQVKRAKELGCEVKHYKTLCNNVPVTLDDGTIIRPEQVVGPDRFVAPVLYLDIPSKEHLRPTLEHNWLAELEDYNTKEYGLIYHFISDDIKEILHLPIYQRFIRSFGKNTIHIISSKDYSPDHINFDESFLSSFKWNFLMPDFYPIPQWTDVAKFEIPAELTQDGYKVLPMVSGQVVALNYGDPARLVEGTQNGEFRDVKYYEKIYNEEVLPIGLQNISPKEEIFKKIQANASRRILLKEVNSALSLKEQVELVVLGTGSALPSKLRNVISNLVRIPYRDMNGEYQFRTVILDAGENTLGSINRMFNEEDVNSIFEELGLIYLSHLHADHHLGIASIIKKYCELQELKPKMKRKKLYIVAPWGYDRFLVELTQIDESIMKSGLIEYISCESYLKFEVRKSRHFKFFNLKNISERDILNVPAVEFNETEKEEFGREESTRMYELSSMLKISNFKTCYAEHCDKAYSVSINFTLDRGEDFIISYSGDTRPTKAFASLGEGSDLLIHESTLGDDKFEDAEMKRHSTTSEAIHVGILMKARNVLLTHFSQRYKLFTGAEQVFRRLEDPFKNVCFDKPEPTMGLLKIEEQALGEVAEQDQGVLEEGAEPEAEPKIEELSAIFRYKPSPGTSLNAAQQAVMFAFDNMYVRLGRFGEQRRVYEAEGRRVGLLLADDGDVEEPE